MTIIINILAVFNTRFLNTHMLSVYLFYCSTVYSGKQLFCKARDDTSVISFSHDTKNTGPLIQKLFKNLTTI